MRGKMSAYERRWATAGQVWPATRGSAWYSAPMRKTSRRPLPRLRMRPRILASESGAVRVLPNRMAGHGDALAIFTIRSRLFFPFFFSLDPCPLTPAAGRGNMGAAPLCRQVHSGWNGSPLPEASDGHFVPTTMAR